MSLKLTDSNFTTEALENDGLSVVDFWAPWCGPCKMIAPIIDQLASEYEGKAVIGKVNVDDNSEIPRKYGVRSIPTIIFLKNGQEVHKMVGATSKKVLEDKIKEFL